MAKMIWEFKNMSADTAELRIVGEVGWETDELGFTQKVDELVEAGIKNVVVYINSVGGSVFDGYEMVNQLKKFDKVDIKVGAIAASIACYIACAFDNITSAENSIFMIHECSGGAYGSASEVESKLELMKKINYEINRVIMARMNDDGKAKLEEYWGKKDLWLTADEAKAYGIVSEIEAVKIDEKDLAGVIPTDLINKLFNQNSEKKMNELLAFLGLQDNATKEQVEAKFNEKVAEIAKSNSGNISDEITKLENAMKDLKDDLEKKSVAPKSIGEIVVDELAKNKFSADKIDNNAVVAKIPVRNQVADPMTTVTTGVEHPLVSQRFAGVAGLEGSKTPVFDLLFKGTSQEYNIAWVDRKNKQGASAFVAEGELKPVISFEYETGMSAPQTIAGMSNVTRQLLQSYPAIAREVEQIIKNDLAVVIEKAVVDKAKESTFGGGVAVSASAYTGLNALSGKIDKPTYIDAILAAGLQIENTHATAKMNAVIVPKGFKTLLSLMKDDNGRLLASDYNFAMQDLTFVESADIATDEFIALDSNLWNVMDYKDGLEVRISDSHDDNFAKNISTIRVEKEVFMWHREIDEASAVKAKFAIVIADLAKV